MKHIVFLLVAIVFGVTVASAATTEPAERGPFDKGTWDFSLTGSYIAPIRFSDDQFYNFTADVGYYLWNNTSASLELQGYYVNQPDYTDAVIAGAGILMRTHLITFDRWSIFIDGGGGVSYASNPVPESGTHFNFTTKVGAGATFELRENTFLIGGARYFHLSNGQIHGKDQNPSYDGIQIWGGMMWTW